MRVLIYSSSFFSDGSLPLYKAMKNKGIDVTLLFELNRPKSCLFDTSTLIPQRGIFKATEYQCFKKYESYCNLDDVYVENNPNASYWHFQTLVSTHDVIRFINKGKFDIIHTDLVISFWKLLLLKYRKKIVNVIHEPFIREGSFRGLFNFFKYIDFKLISKIVLLNNTMKDDFCNHFGIKPTKVFVNRLGPFDCVTALKPYDNSVDREKIVFWGRIAQYKGVEYLCKAMLKVHENNPNAHLVIAGGGSFYFDMTPYKGLSYIKIENRFLEMSDLVKIISDSAFVVCPYTSVTQSGPVITSLVLDKPVIGTDLGAMREMIIDGFNGLLVPPCDVNALANAMIRLINDVSFQKQLQENVKKQNEANNTWSEVVDKYLEIYQSDL